MEGYKFILSGSRALWGNITPNVRKVSIFVENHIITVAFYYDTPPTELEIELSEDTASEVIADFPEPYQIDCERIVVNVPKRIEFLGHLIYSRYEESHESTEN